MQRFNFVMLVALVNVFLLDPSCGMQEVCYGKYGCFSKASPFDNRLVKLPQDPSSVGTTFKLFTRSNRNDAQLVDDNNEEKLQRSSFDISKRTIVIVHGWKESDSGSWVPSTKDALLDREDCNAILVGWSEGSNTAYEQASGNTRLVGVQIAELIKFLISSNSGSSSWADRFYIVGFSLGAQIAGYAGRHLLTEGMSLGRITGLDPAGPYFGGSNAALHLDRSDAKYVDVIHTDLGFAGTPLTVSDIDFFPNGGRTQPGCPSFPNPLALEHFFACSHMRAPEYYIASVKNECSWKAYPCSNVFYFNLGFCKKCNGECSSMGYFADQTKKTGKYYLRTNSKAPFCGLD